jgi:hypothetical protein
MICVRYYLTLAFRRLMGFLPALNIVHASELTAILFFLTVLSSFYLLIFLN